MKMETRIGMGVDAHRFATGRPLILGGVKIPHEQGLLGHSDADALTHSLCDALLGALALGDIGQHFPDNDPIYNGISSLLLLERVMELVRTKGWELVNGDITVVAQRPKLAPYMEKMTGNLATHCGVAPERISIKATTTEAMGFTGRGEGIASVAIVLVGKF